MLKPKLLGQDKRLFTHFVLSVTILFVFAFGLEYTAMAQQVCKQELEQARFAYQSAKADTALALIEGCLRREDITDETKVTAYELQALTYLSIANREQARESVKRLLDINPDYQTPAEERSEFKELVERVRQARVAEEPEAKTQHPPTEIEKKKPSKTWLWVGLGAIAVGGGALGLTLASGGGNGNATSNGVIPQKLPNPPGDPGGN